MTASVFQDLFFKAAKETVGDREPLYLKSMETIGAWYKRWGEFKDDPVDVWKLLNNPETFLHSIRDRGMAYFFDKMHKSLIPASIRLEKRKYIVKVPALSHYTSLLNALYTGLPIVYNVRHPVLNVASIIEPNYDRGWSFEKILQWYTSFFSNDILKYLERNNCLVTRYEDLIFKRGETTKLILTHLKLIDATKMLSDSFSSYPNAKVQWKTEGRLDMKRPIKTLPMLSPDQIIQTLKVTDYISQMLYKDLPLTKIISMCSENAN